MNSDIYEAGPNRLLKDRINKHGTPVSVYIDAGELGQHYADAWYSLNPEGAVTITCLMINGVDITKIVDSEQMIVIEQRIYEQIKNWIGGDRI